MDMIVELLPAIISLLEDITLNSDIQVDENTTIGNWNIKSRNDAQNLINAVTFPFIVRHILDLTRPLTVKLQRKEMDLLKAKDEIASLKSDLRHMQADIDARHHHLYTEAVNLARRVSV